MSSVFFKFKSAKSFDTVTFDGTGISVFDLKRQIMIQKKLGQGLDFDLIIENAQSHEVYENDAAIVPRNSQILVTRTPPSGKIGSASKYLTSQLSVSTNLPGPGPRGRAANAVQPIQPPPVEPPKIEEKVDENLTEEERIAAMFQQSEAYWQSQERVMMFQRPVRPPPRPVQPKQSAQTAIVASKPIQQSHNYDLPPTRPPPPGYVCFRCGERDHFINACPTIGNADFDANRPRYKRTTGIPKMFLQKTEEKTDSNTLMLTNDGEVVTVKTNEHEWEKMTQKRKRETCISDDLKCKLCKELLSDAVETRCCRSNYCDSCIRSHLSESSTFTCVNCKTVQYPNDLVPNKSLRTRVDQLLRESQGRPTSAPKVEPKSGSSSPRPDRRYQRKHYNPHYDQGYRGQRRY